MGFFESLARFFQHPVETIREAFSEEYEDAADKGIVERTIDEGIEAVEDIFTGPDVTESTYDDVGQEWIEQDRGSVPDYILDWAENEGVEDPGLWQDAHILITPDGIELEWTESDGNSTSEFFPDINEFFADWYDYFIDYYDVQFDVDDEYTEA